MLTRAQVVHLLQLSSKDRDLEQVGGIMEKQCVMMVALLTVLGFAGLWQQASAERCFWISDCQNFWLGGCPKDYVAVETSNDCQGLCAMPQFPTCHPFFTGFQCCSEGKARESTRCKSRALHSSTLRDWSSQASRVANLGNSVDQLDCCCCHWRAGFHGFHYLQKANE